MRPGWTVLPFVLAASLAACSDADSEPNAGAGGSGGTAGSGGGSAGTGAAAGSGGSAAGTGGGASGSGGSSASSCAGPFQDPRLLLTAPAGFDLSSPTLSPDELELFYSLVAESDDTGTFHRSTRASKADPFPQGTPQPELDAACPGTERRTIDLTTDGLRAYIVCYAFDVDGVNPVTGELRVARRASLTSPFVVDSATYGTVGSSFAIGPDELTGYASNEAPSANGVVSAYARATTTEPFVKTTVPGLEDVVLTAPDISPDDLLLAGNSSPGIGTVRRTSKTAPFGELMLTPAPAGVAAIGAPEYSVNGCSFYYIQVDAMASQLYALTR